jgi:hypothetical protein
MNKQASVSFMDVFDNSFLEEVYVAFGKWANTPDMTQDFSTVVYRDVLVGLAWENTNKILNNLGVSLKKEDVCLFLQSHCFMVWFPKKVLAEHQFTELEKSALCSWIFFCEGDDEDDDQELFQAVNEIRKEASAYFIDIAFRANLESYVIHYREFMERNGVTV